jgi:hypothetical protein
VDDCARPIATIFTPSASAGVAECRDSGLVPIDKILQIKRDVAQLQIAAVAKFMSHVGRDILRASAELKRIEATPRYRTADSSEPARIRS